MENKTIAHRLEMLSVHCSSKKKKMTKTAAAIRPLPYFLTSKVMLIILQENLVHIWNKKCQIFKLDSEKEETQHRIANIQWLLEHTREF